MNAKCPKSSVQITDNGGWGVMWGDECSLGLNVVVYEVHVFVCACVVCVRACVITVWVMLANIPRC